MLTTQSSGRRQLGLGLETEDAIEMYYSAAVTPCLGVTLDPQIVDSALEKVLIPTGQLKAVPTAVVAGLRVYARF
jgi:porin